MIEDQAQIIAINALAYIAGDETALRTLMTQTGTSEGELREGAANADFLAGILDFLCRQEDILVAFCESSGTTPEDVMKANHVLSRFDTGAL